MHTFEYAVTTKATPSLAWEVYTNWKMWHTFANIYGRCTGSTASPGVSAAEWKSKFSSP